MSQNKFPNINKYFTLTVNTHQHYTEDLDFLLAPGEEGGPLLVPLRVITEGLLYQALLRWFYRKAPEQ